jgi:peroxiredoxin
MAGRHAGVGSPAPPLDLPTASGATRSLAEFRGKPVLLTFLGPANCQFCRAHVVRVVHAHDEIAGTGAHVLFVGYHDHALVTGQMLRDLKLPYVLLLDPTREAYHRWGCRPPGFKSMLSVSLYVTMVRVMLNPDRGLGKVPPGPGEVGGDFVVSPNGTLTFANRLKSLHDHAKIPDLLQAIRASA